MYNDYLREVAERFASRFADIAADFNFELGVEFEITLCRVLRQVLPQRYGICRGHVVTREGDARGDDIVIYDRDNYPTLRMVEQEGFERRESIPFEAVYAYIEAKHTLHIEGTDAQSVAKACKQVGAVKSLTRAPVPWTYQDPYLARPRGKVEIPTYWPPTRNQLFGAVIARHVRPRAGAELLTDPDQVTRLLASKGCSLGPPPHPDLLIAGADVVCLPTINHAFHSPFQIERKSHLSSLRVDGLAFGIGTCSMLFALDMMRLGGMPWPLMIAESVGLRMVTDEQRGTEQVLFGFPCFIISKDAEAGVQTVGNDQKTCVAVFTTAENAAGWLPLLHGCRHQVRAIDSIHELRSVLKASASEGIDEVALDPQPKKSEFKSIHIAFFLEALDQGKGESSDSGPG